MSKSSTEAKIAAARDAVEKAAALLLDHAEGVGMLAMMARHAEPPGPATVSFEDAGQATIRNRPAEQAFWQAAVAAATFAGRFETFREARDSFWPTNREAALRDAVERLVGPGGGFPPPLESVPEKIGVSRFGLTPARVHAQAWRSHLAASASKATMARVV